jgi:hypothetical protein
MLKNQAMKNDQSINLNNAAEGSVLGATETRKNESYPISLYMLLVVDAILITSILFLTAKIIF